MADYHVVWEIDIVADSPESAAKQALAIQRDPASMATVFEVWDENGKNTEVDLEKDETDDGEAV